MNLKQGPLENAEHTNLFIAAQGPMKNTIESFWLMMIKNNSSLIVTLSNVKEDGRVHFYIYIELHSINNFK